MVNNNINLVSSIKKVLIYCPSVEDYLINNHLVLFDKEFNIIYKEGNSSVKMKEIENIAKEENLFFIVKARRVSTIIKYTKYNIEIIVSPIYIKEEIFGYTLLVSENEENFETKVIVELINRLVCNEFLILNSIEKMTDSKNRTLFPELTQREYEILELLFLGFSDKEISVRLNLSIPTIRSYINNLFNTFNANSRLKLVNIFYNTKINSLINGIGD